MENINAILEKLMLNRAALLIKRYDKELKEILDSDLQAYRSHTIGKSGKAAKNRLVA